MKVGDLVKHKRTWAIGVIIEIAPVEGTCAELFTIQWNDEVFSRGPHWRSEIKVINSIKNKKNS